MSRTGGARLGSRLVLLCWGLLTAALLLGGCGSPPPTAAVPPSATVPPAAAATPPPPAEAAAATATAAAQALTSVITPAATSPLTGPATATPQAVAVPTSVAVARVAVAAAVAPDAAAARVIDRFVGARRQVALTFDAGADVGFAAEILDTLGRQLVVASFGMTGRWAERHPALVRRMADEGHQLMNHTYDHSSFTGVSMRGGAMSTPLRREQIERTEAIVRSIAGVEMRPYFRPPYGDYDASVNADIAASGYHFNVMWTVDSLGWKGLPAGGIVQRCLQRATPGAIFIFHVGAASQDAAALDAIIEGLRRDGYAFATIRQMGD